MIKTQHSSNVLFCTKQNSTMSSLHESLWSACSRCKIELECISGSSSTGTNRRMLWCVCESAAPALSRVSAQRRRRRHKRGCVSNCDATHSCTADHAFSAGPCCTASRWHSWRRNPAPGDARSSLFLWPPSPSLSAALCLGSYPAGEQGREAKCGSLLFGRNSFSEDDVARLGAEGSELFVCVVKYAAPQVHLVFVERAGHPVPQRAEPSPHLGAFLHLLSSVLLVFISAQTGKGSRNTYVASVQAARVEAEKHNHNLPLYKHFKGLLKVRYYINFKIVFIHSVRLCSNSCAAY